MNGLTMGRKIEPTDLFLVVIVVLGCVFFIYSPLDRAYDSARFIHLVAYKPLEYASRDAVWMLSGIVGAVLVLASAKRAVLGWSLLLFFALGFLLSALTELLFGVMYALNAYLWLSLLLVSLVTLIVFVCKKTIPVQVYPILFPGLILLVFLINLLYIKIIPGFLY